MEIRYFVENPTPLELLQLLEALVQVNHAWLRRNPDAPGIYESGVRYIREGLPELWYDIPSMLKRTPEPGEDCDGLSCYRAAELRNLGYDAHPALRLYRRGDGSGVYHAISEIRTPDGWLYDDPSARLGMLGSRPRVAGDAFYSPSVPLSCFKAVGELPSGRRRAGGRIRLVGRQEEEAPEAAPVLPETMRLVTMYRTGRDWLTRPSPFFEEQRTTVVVGDPPRALPPLAVSGELQSIYYLPVLHANQDQ